MSILELRDVGFKYQLASKPCFRKVNLSIEKGEFIGIVGKNGVGKTTLCNIMRGIIPLFTEGDLRGEILLEGRPLNEYDRGVLAEKIGFVFQNPFIQMTGIKKTVFEEIAYGLENLGVEREEIIKRVNAAIEELKISHLKDKNPTRLSGGQSQRVAIASVLVMNPEILLVDEPTSQLDPIGTEEVFNVLGILKKNRKTVVLVEHKINLISEYVDRVIVLDDGYVAMDGPTEEVLSNPEIEKYGVQMPNVAQLSYRLIKEKNIAFSTIPTNMDKAVEEYRKMRKVFGKNE